MNIIIILGPGAVGKMTVGQEISKVINFGLFHNHLVIEPVLNLFKEFKRDTISKVRDLFLEEYLKSDNKGLIVTLMMAFDIKSEWDYLNHLLDIFKDNEIYCLELVANQEIRLERNNSENRLSHKASKRDINFSHNRILYEDSNYRLESLEGELPFKNYMKIDNSNLSPKEVSDLFLNKFHELLG